MIVSLVKGSAVPHVAILEVDAQHLALLNHYIFYLFFVAVWSVFLWNPKT